MSFWNDLPDDIKRQLPQPPTRELFESDAEHAQAEGFWQMLVARMIATRFADRDLRAGAAAPGGPAA